MPRPPSRPSLLLALLLAAGCGGGSGGAGVDTGSPGTSCDGDHGGLLERISLDYLGRETETCSECKNNSHPAISADGQVIVWESDADLVAPWKENPGNKAQIYLLDVPTRTVRVLSIVTEGPGLGELGNGGSIFPQVSGDGERVLFTSQASNLDPDDEAGGKDLFIHDVAEQSTWRLSERPDGSGFNGETGLASLSFDGDLVAFSSTGTNIEPLVATGCGQPDPGVLQETRDVFVFDQELEHFEWVSIAAGCATPDGDSDQPHISADGRYVAFRSEATNLLPQLTISAPQVYVRDLWTGELVLASARPDGQPGDGESAKPFLSADGRWLAFESEATDLLPGDTNGERDIYLRDLTAGVTIRISLAADGAEPNGSCAYPYLSGDGRRVVYTSLADNLVPGDDTSGYTDLFVHDRDASGDGILDQAGDACTHRLSRNAAAEGGNWQTGGNAALSADGRAVVFMSEASNLVLEDTNGEGAGQCSPVCQFGRDVFLWTLED